MPKGGRGAKLEGRRAYSEQEREQFLAHMVVNMNPHTNRPNFTQCSKELKVSRVTLMTIWDNRDQVMPDILAGRKEWMEETIDACKRVALKAILQAENTLCKSNAGESAKVAGILIDKQALLQGQPTSIVDQTYKNLTEEERQVRIDELEQRRIARRSRIPAES